MILCLPKSGTARGVAIGGAYSRGRHSKQRLSVLLRTTIVAKSPWDTYKK